MVQENSLPVICGHVQELAGTDVAGHESFDGGVVESTTVGAFDW